MHLTLFSIADAFGLSAGDDAARVRALLLHAEDCLIAARSHVSKSQELLAADIGHQLDGVRRLRRRIDAVREEPVDVWAPLTRRLREFAIAVARGLTN